ncbi:hypothetical protein EV702DRAFT_1049339 [Suillus placidus]|uniref:Uncharacterized protein n=1 Tax=Suillus placidus TaxID=48579 RepID=A0A9P7CYD7_9AGAM|nr:hypothetical protein EV702DRAFT_1049339 [Suillus placidus]
MSNQPWDSAAAAAHGQENFPTIDDTFNFYRDNLGFPWAGQFPPNLPVLHYRATGHAQGIHSPIPYHPPYYFKSAADGMMAAAGGHQLPPAFTGAWGPDEDPDVAQPGAFIEAWARETAPSDYHDPIDHTSNSFSPHGHLPPPGTIQRDNSVKDFTQVKDIMKKLLLKSSLFPAKNDIAVKANAAWTTTVEDQPIEYQNLARSSAVSGEKKLVNMVETMCNDLRETGRHFVYFKYNLKDGYMVLPAGVINGVEARVDQVAELTKDESFLDITLEINGSLVVIPFGNTPVLEFIAYTTYDSKYQYD